MDYNNLSAEQKDEFAQQYEAELKQKEEAQKNERKTYSHLRHITVEKVFAKLQATSSQLEKAKEEFYNEFNALLELKANCYGIKDGQKSHDWSNADGTITIKTGYNEIDFWDDTKSVGLVKVNNWLDKTTTEENKDDRILVRELLKPNKKGDLKANRVIDIVKAAEQIGDKELIEAVKIIMDSHKSIKSGTYIQAIYTNDKGEKVPLPLSFSSIK